MHLKKEFIRYSKIVESEFGIANCGSLDKRIYLIDREDCKMIEIAKLTEYSDSRVPAVRAKETANTFLGKPACRRWKSLSSNLKMLLCTNGVNTLGNC